jgi:probable phosphoglycerate mutase
MKQIFVIRHGQTEWNLARRMQGRLDSPLTREGAEQAHTHGLLLKKLGTIEEMFVSPSGRTRETAYILNSYVRARLHYSEALLERDVGAWSGLTVEELEDAYPRAWQERLEDPFYHRPPDGENLADMGDRCEAFIQQMLDGPATGVALVTHQIMSRVIVGRLMGLTPAQTIRVIHPNQALYRIELEPGTTSISYYVAGEGPFDGLLHHGDGETMPPHDGHNK